MAGTPFNKIWTMGMDQAHGWSETEAVWGGCFVELQVGVAPTQSHTFEVPAHSSHHHSEYWQLMGEMREPEQVYAADYREAIAAVSGFVNSEAGVPPAVWAEQDEFMRRVSERALTPEDTILFNASAWGGLDSLLTRREVPQSVRFFASPTTEYEKADDATPWRELLMDGTFSNASLGLTPRSWVAGGDPAWLELLETSGRLFGFSWLHHLHIATDAAERFDLKAARTNYEASLELYPSAHALRGLGVMVGDPGAYHVPDVACDMTQARLQQLGPDRVRVSGVRGLPPTDSYKVSTTFFEGWRNEAFLLVQGFEAGRKARATGEALFARQRAMLAEAGLPGYTETRVEALGDEALYQPANRRPPGPEGSREVVLKISCRHEERAATELFAREFVAAATSMAPGTMAIMPGRPKPSPLVRGYSCLVPKAQVPVSLVAGPGGAPQSVAVAVGGGFERSASETVEGVVAAEPLQARGPGLSMRVPLLRLCLGRRY